MTILRTYKQEQQHNALVCSNCNERFAVAEVLATANVLTDKEPKFCPFCGTEFSSTVVTKAAAPSAGGAA